MNVFITGANRGLGLELTRQILQRGDRVFATCRKPDQAEALQELCAEAEDRLTIHALDVSDEDSVKRCVGEVAEACNQLDLLINNAGVGVFDDFESVSFEDMEQSLCINVIGPILVTRALLGHLADASDPKVVNISSKMGSIALRSEISSRALIYPTSKAALNMASVQMAHELRPRRITVLALSPGWVKTDMGGQKADLSPEESVEQMLKVIATRGLDDTGKFLSIDNTEVPW